MKDREREWVRETKNESERESWLAQVREREMRKSDRSLNVTQDTAGH